MFEAHRRNRHDHEHQRHRGQHRPALPHVADHAAEGQGQRGRDQEDRQHLDEVGERRRILVGMRRVGVHEAAAVGAEHLDRFLRGDRAHGQGLGRLRNGFGHGIALVVLDRLASSVELGHVVLGGLHGRHVLVGIEVLDDALADQEHGIDQRDRQQHIERDAGEIDPGVADGLGRVAGETADQRDDDDDAGGGGEEVLHRQAEHLGQVAHRRFAAIALPVGVGDEADGGVEGRIRADVGHRLGIQRQPELQPLQGIDRQRAEGVEQQDGESVFQPAHFLILAHAAEAIQHGLDGAAEAQGEPAALHHIGDIDAQWLGHEQQDHQIRSKQEPGMGSHEKSSGLSRAAIR